MICVHWPVTGIASIIMYYLYIDIRTNTFAIVCIYIYIDIMYYIIFAQVEWFGFSDSLDCWVVFHRDMSWSWPHPYQDSASFSHKTIARRRSLAHPCRVTLWSLLVPPSADCCEVYKLLSGHENVMTERLNPTYSRRLSPRESNPSLQSKYTGRVLPRLRSPRWWG